MTPSEDPTQSDRDPLLGRVIAGNFRIERLIGSGATGNVYQAEQLSLGKEVAVKVLHPHLMGDDRLIKRFQREAKSASRLNHPNSIQIIDSGEDEDGTLFIAMELLSGRDLAQVIRDEFPLTLPRIVRIMSQVLSALDEAHAQSVIHRDLKPSNIMLIERRGEPDFVKVCDYGIAKAQLDESKGESQMLTVQGLVCGTPEYMSPEQARGEPLDGRTDLYSAAVILYHMATGDIPFRASTPIGIVSRHLSEAPVIPSSRRPDPSIPPDLDDLILRGLAKSRELRPASAAVFREELERIGSGQMGRRTLANQSTLTSEPATGDDLALTAHVPVASAPRSKKAIGLSGKAVAIGLVAAAVGGAALMVMARRASPPPTIEARVEARRATTEARAAASAPPPGALGPREGAAAPNAPAPTDRSGPGEPGVAMAAEAAPRSTAALRASPGAHDPGPAHRKPAAGSHAAHPSPATASRPAAATARAAASAEAPAPSTAPVAPPGSPAPPSTRTAAGAAATDPAPGRTDDKSPAAPRAPRDLIAEGERLLAQGDVSEACRRGEEAKRLAPRLPATHKFLGKCYMRAGNATLAKESYRRYLELSPNAQDALFIESIVK